MSIGLPRLCLAVEMEFLLGLGFASSNMAFGPFDNRISTSNESHSFEQEETILLTIRAADSQGVVFHPHPVLD